VLCSVGLLGPNGVELLLRPLPILPESWQNPGLSFAQASSRERVKEVKEVRKKEKLWSKTEVRMIEDTLLMCGEIEDQDAQAAAWEKVSPTAVPLTSKTNNHLQASKSRRDVLALMLQ
jgi:hypothetical protein